MTKLKNIIALLIVALIPALLMIWFRVHQTTGFASRELILYPLLFGGGSIIILLLVKKYFLRETFQDFNRGKVFVASDVLWGLALVAVYFILFYVHRLTLMDLLEFRSNTELLGLMLDMRENPLLIALWFLPVLWIGISLYEELIRVFLLSTFWKFSENKIWIAFAILFASILIGFTHWSQGPYGIVTIAIKSVVSCIFFYKIRRLAPLVIAHALYDGIQVGLLLITYPH